MSRNSTHINCNQIAGTVNQGIWLNDCDPCAESGYVIPNITQWLRYKFQIVNGGGTFAGPVASGDIATGTDIGGWNDVIGTNHGVQATAGEKPHWDDADLSILFDNVDDEFTITNVAYAAADNFVVAIGMSPTGSFANNMLWYSGGATSVMVVDSTNIAVTLGGTTTTVTGPTLATNSAHDCAAYNIVLRREYGICQLFVAGVPWGPSFVYTGTVNVANIGSNGTNHLNGKVYNFMQFDRALTDKEIWCLDCYLCGTDDSQEPTSCRIDYDEVDCNGDTDGSLTATMLGATGAVTYAWSNGATTQTITGLAAGTYTCTMTDSAGTPNVTTCTGYVYEPALALACTTTTTQPFYDTANVLQPATIKVTVAGGWGAPLANSNIVWTKDGASYTPSNADHFDITTLLAGTYAYTVTDVNGCTCTGSVVITIPGDPTLEITCGHTPIECHDETAAWGVMFDPSTTFNTTATITMTGSVSGAHAQSPITVSSLPASSTNFGQTGNWWLNTVANQRLAAGEVWTITVTDTGSPVRTASCTITTVNPEDIVIQETITQPTACEGLDWSNGALSFIATGGTPPFTYSIAKTTATTGSVSTNIWLNPGAGNYTLTATDDNGCVKTKNVTITCPMDPMITIDHVTTDMSCHGESPCTGQAVFTPSATTSAGFTFQLLVDDPSGVTFYDSGQLATFNAYTLTGLCAGTYSYTFNATNTTSGAVTPLASGVNFTIVEPPALALSVVTVADGCNGSPGTGSIDLTVTGGTPAYTYAWSASNGGAVPAGQATNQDLTALVAGSYTVVVTDSEGCTISRGWDIGEPCALDTTLSAAPIECAPDGDGVEFLCNWQLNGQVNPPNNWGGLNDAWNNGHGWDHDREIFQTSQIWSTTLGNSPIDFACWHPYTDGVNHPDYPNLAASTTFVPLKWNGTAACKLELQPAQGLYQRVTGLTVGNTYNFSIHVGTGSTASGVWKMAVYTINANGTLTILGSETSTTSTGLTTATFIATGTEHVINVHFAGIAGAGTSGEYKMVGSIGDMVGTTSAEQLGGGVTMSSDGKTLITGGIDGETITYKLCTYGGSGASTFPYAGSAWVIADKQMYKNGHPVFSRRENVEISHDGTRMIQSDQFWQGSRGRAFASTWVSTDATNCLGYWQQMGENFEGVAQDNLGTVAMSGDGTTVAIGSPSHDANKGEVKIYTWNSGTSTWDQKGSTLDGQASGDKFGFSLALSDDGAEVVIGAPEHDALKGTVRAYEWGGSSWAQKGADLDGATGDRLGYSVSMNGAGDVLAAGSINHDGDKGTVRVYTYAASAWSQTGADMDGVVGDPTYVYPGDYSACQIQLNTAGDKIVIGASHHDTGAGMTVKLDAGHMRVFENISGTWTELDDIEIHGGAYAGSSTYALFGTDVAMNGSGTMVVGGAPGSWASSQPQTAGEMNVFEWVTTSNAATGIGCLNYVSVTGQNTTSNTTDVIVSTTCGTPGYTYAWTTPTATPQGALGSNAANAVDLIGVPAGTYQVVTTDANGCTETSSIVIPEASGVTNSISVTAQAGCSPEICLGAAESDNTFSGATYLWTTDAAYTTPVTGGVGSTSHYITQQCAGTYYLQITLDNGCVWEGSCTITGGTSGMTLSAVVTDADMCDDCCGDIDLTVTGGAAPFTYIWSNGQTTQDLSCVMPGSYTVQVTDDNGCIETATYTVGISNYAIAFALAGSPSTNQLLVSGVSGGTPPYAYQWTLNGVNFAAGTTSTSIIPDLTLGGNGTYCLTVHDDKGCTFTDCYGVDFSTTEVREYNCTTSPETCNPTKTKEDILGACHDEKHGSTSELSGDGTTIIVGSRMWSSKDAIPGGANSCLEGDDHPGWRLDRDGRVKIYRETSGSWNQIGQTLFSTGSQDNEYFGDQVSISNDGNTVAIGTRFWNGQGIGSGEGYVKVFDYNSTYNTWVPRKVLYGTAGISWSTYGEGFGSKVSLSGDGLRLAVGVADDKPAGQIAPFAIGSVRVWDYSTGTGNWTQKGVDVPGKDSASGLTYPSVYHLGDVIISNDGSTLFVGSWEGGSGFTDPYEGVAIAYRFSAGAWNQIGSDIQPYTPGTAEALGSDFTGLELACSTDGNILAVASPKHGHDEPTSGWMGDHQGSVHVYEYSGGAWGAKGGVIYGDNVGDQWGDALDLSGDGLTLLISSRFYDTCKGRAQVYKFRTGGNYEEVCSTWIGSTDGCGGFGAAGNGNDLGRSSSITTDGSRISFSQKGPSSKGLVQVWDLNYAAAGSSNACIECYTLGCGTYSTMAACIEACTPAASWNCEEGRCVDPGDGTGTYATEELCLAAGCTTLRTYYDCKKGVGCVGAVGVGTYTTLAACEAACTSPSTATYYCEILCPDSNEAEQYTDEEESYAYEGEDRERRKKETVTGGGRCRIRKDVSPETGSTVYYDTEELCRENCPWCKDIEKYDDIS